MKEDVSSSLTIITIKFIIMKRLIITFIAILLFIPVNAVEVLSETVIDKEQVEGVYQDTSSSRPKYYLVYSYNGKRTMASISKSEVQKYFTAIKLGIYYQVVIQQLKTKRRAIIRV